MKKEIQQQLKRLEKAFPSSSVNVSCETWSFVKILGGGEKVKTYFNAFVSTLSKEPFGILSVNKASPKEAVDDIFRQCKEAGIEYVEE